MSVQRPQLQDKLNIVMQKWDRNDWNSLFTLENYGGYNNRFLLAFFSAAFRLMLKIFSLAAKFGGLGVYYILPKFCVPDNLRPKYVAVFLNMLEVKLLKNNRRVW